MQSACTQIKHAIGIKNLMGKNPKINKKFDCNKQNSVGKNPKINNRFGLLIQHGRVGGLEKVSSVRAKLLARDRD